MVSLFYSNLNLTFSRIQETLMLYLEQIDQIQIRKLCPSALFIFFLSLTIRCSGNNQNSSERGDTIESGNLDSDTQF